MFSVFCSQDDDCNIALLQVLLFECDAPGDACGIHHTTWLWESDVLLAGSFFEWQPSLGTYSRLPSEQVRLLGETFDFERTHNAFVGSLDFQAVKLVGEDRLVGVAEIQDLWPVTCRKCRGSSVEKVRSQHEEYGLVVVHDFPRAKYFKRLDVVCKCCREQNGRRVRTAVSLDDVRRVVPDVLALSVKAGASEGGRWSTLITLDYAWFAMDVFRDNFCLKVFFKQYHVLLLWLLFL